MRCQRDARSSLDLSPREAGLAERGLLIHCPTHSKMEFKTALADLQEEYRCPVCVDYFRDPVTIDCGHNFCHDCLSVSWNDLSDAFPCPVCRFSFPRKDFRRNLQLRDMTGIAKLLQIRRGKRKRQEEHAVCEKHSQFLTLFCMKDSQVLCTQCSFSTEHRGHYICPIKKAAIHHRQILKGSIEPLKNNAEQVEKVLTLQRSNSPELRKKVKKRKEEINSEFEQMRLFLQNEQEVILQEMQDEEQGILAKLNENPVTFSDHVSTLKNRLKEMKGEHRQSDLAFMTNVKKSIQHKRHHLRSPDLFSFRFKKYGFSLPPQYSGLDRIRKPFQIEVTLDPDTASPQLIISEDRKSVRYRKKKQSVDYNPRRFYLCPAVLGSQITDDGRHYWEVDVGNKPQWTLGVCQDSLPRNWRNPPSVVGGFWAIGRSIESGYVAFGPKKTQLLPVLRPSKIGIFLDFELGKVSFYNLNDRSLLHTFNDSLTSAIWPYFYAGTDSEPLKITSVVER